MEAAGMTMPISNEWVTDPLQIAHLLLERNGKYTSPIWCDSCPLTDNEECDCLNGGTVTLERIKAWLAENEPEGMC